MRFSTFLLKLFRLGLDNSEIRVVKILKAREIFDCRVRPHKARKLWHLRSLWNPNTKGRSSRVLKYQLLDFLKENGILSNSDLLGHVQRLTKSTVLVTLKSKDGSQRLLIWRDVWFPGYFADVDQDYIVRNLSESETSELESAMAIRMSKFLSVSE